MRKVLILGIASLGALASVQPAFAVQKTVCQWHLTGAYVGDVTSGPLGIGIKTCKQIDVGPAPTAWKGNSATATQTYSLSKTHQK